MSRGWQGSMTMRAERTGNRQRKRKERLGKKKKKDRENVALA